jgi:adenine-specific DNA-methyltransferase
VQEGKLSLESKDIVAEKRQELLRLFPEAQTEGGKIDFDQLKRALGESVDAGRERYGMNWPGKADCFRLIQSPSTATLLPVREESVRFDESENLIIEGDNLEVLKLLQKGYQNKVKMIYIDPPYNTGNDFIYPDDFSDSLTNYLRYTGQSDAQGVAFSNNLESDGRFHSNWLNMMYPRLYLARNLLRDDGVIFISIDDAEIENLRSLCDSVFGEKNFLANFVRRRRLATGMRENPISPDHEYVLAFARDLQKVKLFGFKRRAEDFPFTDSVGSYRSTDLTVGMTRAMRPNQFYPIQRNSSSPEYLPPDERVWRFEPTTMKSQIAKGNIIWPEENLTGKMTRPRFKTRFDPDDHENTNPVSTWIATASQSADQDGEIIELDAGFNQEATKELRDIFGEQILEYPKPVSLLSALITVGSQDNDLVLDFFAGSGTTGHATLEANRINQTDRRFILVQLPEPTDRKDYKTIAEITKERIRRVIQRQDKEAEGQLNLLQEGKPNRKEGFRVFNLAPSNFKVWNAHTDEGVEGIERQMELAVNHIMPDRTAEDLYYEILMKSEYPLTAKVENFNAAGIAAFSVEDDALIVCVERKVTAEAVAAIAKRSPSKVIFLDEAFSGNDQLKANAKMNFESAGVKRFETV